MLKNANISHFLSKFKKFLKCYFVIGLKKFFVKYIYYYIFVKFCGNYLIKISHCDKINLRNLDIKGLICQTQEKVQLQ